MCRCTWLRHVRLYIRICYLTIHVYCSHFGSRYTLGWCRHAGLYLFVCASCIRLHLLSTISKEANVLAHSMQSWFIKQKTSFLVKFQSWKCRHSTWDSGGGGRGARAWRQIERIFLTNIFQFRFFQHMFTSLQNFSGQKLAYQIPWQHTYLLGPWHRGTQVKKFQSICRSIVSSSCFWGIYKMHRHNICMWLVYAYETDRSLHVQLVDSLASSLWHKAPWPNG